MSGGRTNGSGALLLTVTMLAVALTVLAGVCAGAVKTERRAADLSEAVLRAGSAADVFYASETPEELAQRLGGTLRDGVVSVACDERSTLAVTLGEAGGLAQADISVRCAGEEIFTLCCRKAAERGGMQHAQ